VLERLRQHPFEVEAFFRRSLVLTYAVPAQQLEPLIGPGLELDTFGEFGFLAIALVETKELRPRGLPAWLGRDFFLSGYRLFTRLVRPGKATLRGLRILRSDTDRWSMKTAGNLFTHYGYRHAAVLAEATPSRYSVRITTPNAEADLHVDADLEHRPAALPEGSVFHTLEEARSFAGPLPYTFAYEPALKKLVVVKGVRSTWSPEPISVNVQQATYLNRSEFAGARLSNAFYLENVPYWWMRGTLEPIT
jgi:hypothetical protein